MNGTASPIKRSKPITFLLVNRDIIFDTPSGPPAGPIARRINRESRNPHSNCQAHRWCSPAPEILACLAREGIYRRRRRHCVKIKITIRIHSEQLYGNLCADGRQEYAPRLSCHAVADADPELLILKTSACKLYCTPILILINSRWLTSWMICLFRNSAGATCAALIVLSATLTIQIHLNSPDA